MSNATLTATTLILIAAVLVLSWLLYWTRKYLVCLHQSVIKKGEDQIGINADFIRTATAHGSTLDLLSERLDQQHDVLMSHKEGLLDHKTHIDDHSAAILVLIGTDENLSLTIKNIGDALVKLEKIVDPDEPIFNIPPQH